MEIKMKKRNADSFLQIVDLGILGEIEVEVEYSYSPGTPDVRYLPNGDPGYPGDPAELEILKVTYDGENITFLFDGNDTFETLIADEVSALFADRNADAADYYRQCQRDALAEDSSS
jgi:hypothetical protein